MKLYNRIEFGKFEPVDITKIIEEIEDLHPYKQSGNIDSYNDYCQGWADACDVVLSRLEN